jgi:hypothetical protein
MLPRLVVCPSIAVIPRLNQHKSDDQFVIGFSLQSVLSYQLWQPLSRYMANSGLLEDIARCGYRSFGGKWKGSPTPTRAGDSPPGRESTRHVVG